MARPQPVFDNRKAVQAAAALLVTGGMFNALTYMHVTADDALISIRYATNLADGVGLKYNPGQPAVEGFSNPLFTLLTSALLFLGVPALLAVKSLGLGRRVALAVNSRIGRDPTPSNTAPANRMTPGPVSFHAPRTSSGKSPCTIVSTSGGKPNSP